MTGQKGFCRSVLWVRYDWGKWSKFSAKEHKQNAFVKPMAGVRSPPMANLPSSSRNTDHGKVLPRGRWLSSQTKQAWVCVWSHGESCLADE